MDKLGFYGEQNAHIVHANEAFTETIASGAITDPEVRDLAMSLITTEQDAAVDAMQAQYELDIEEAERVPQEDQKRLGEIAAIIAEYETADEQKKRQLGILASFYAQAKEIALSNHENAIDALREEEARLSEKREVPFEGNEHLYDAWTMPVREVVDVEPFMFPEYFDWQNEQPQERELPVENGIEFIFPDDLPLSDEQIREAVQRRYNGRCADASKLLAYLAAEEVGRIWTQKALGDQIYFDSDASQTAKNSRVSALLSNFHHGTVGTIADTLLEVNENYRMQTGRRYPIVNGKRHGKGCRVCRVVDVSKRILDPADNEYVIEWELLRATRIEHAERNAQNASSHETPLASPAKPGESASFELPVDKGDSVGAENPGDDAVEKELNRLEALLADAQIWLAPIVAAMGNNIPLMRVARHDRTSPYYSKTVGTDTNLQRAEAAQIISRHEAETGVITEAHRAIATAILNRNKSILANRTTRTEALLALEKLVADYADGLKDAK